MTLDTDSPQLPPDEGAQPEEPRPAIQAERVPEPKSDGDYLIFRRSHVYMVLLPLAFLAGLSAGYLFWGRQVRAERTQAASAPAAPAGSTGVEADRNPPRYDVSVDDDPALGPQDAPVTIIEFSDFECPFCQKFHAEVFQRILDTYPGEVRFVYRDFPLTGIHPNAISAAEAANCAGEQGDYWVFHDLLFSNRLGLGPDAYVSYAEELDYDVGVFQECLASRRYQDEVQADFEFAARLGVRSTPTFFINGLAVVGAQPFEVFQQVIEQELAGATP